jgi:hypothetical protein
MNDTLLAESVPILMPLFETVREVILSLQWLMGGIFGLYLILVFLRWRESVELKKILKEIRDDIRELSDDIRLVNSKVKTLEKRR